MFILGATNRRAGKAIVHLGERCPFWGATNMMAITASVHFGEHCSFWEEFHIVGQLTRWLRSRV